MGFPKGVSIPFAKLQLAAGSKPRSRIKLISNSYFGAYITMHPWQANSFAVVAT